MPRQARLLLADSCYHILTRGNNRATVFHDPDDFQRYGRLLATYFPEHGVRLYHYCLMTNHVHLVVHAATASGLRQAMQRLNLRYALAYKQRYGHTGHFWQDRFKSLLIDHEAYLLMCGAYVELNPVRAHLVTTPEAYPWSSYRVYAFGQVDPLVSRHPLYEPLGPTATVRQANYRQFVAQQLDQPLPLETRHRALGRAEFLQTVARQVGQPLLTRPRGRPRKALASISHDK